VTVLAALYLAAAVLVRGPWLLFLGVLLLLARTGRLSGTAAVLEVLLLLALEVLARWLEQRGRRVAPWVTIVSAAAALASLVAGLGSLLGTAVASLALSVQRVDDFKAAWERLLRTMEVRAGRFVVGLLLILLPWPH
jgi:AcrR family transcriptional regulator